MRRRTVLLDTAGHTRTLLVLQVPVEVVVMADGEEPPAGAAKAGLFKAASLVEEVGAGAGADAAAAVMAGVVAQLVAAASGGEGALTEQKRKLYGTKRRYRRDDGECVTTPVTTSVTTSVTKGSALGLHQDRTLPCTAPYYPCASFAAQVCPDGSRRGAPCGGRHRDGRARLRPRGLYGLLVRRARRTRGPGREQAASRRGVLRGGGQALQGVRQPSV